MSLADDLSSLPINNGTRKGPAPACDIYGPGDIDTLNVLAQRRDAGEYWTTQQQRVDEKLGIDKPIRHNQFRYHWSGKCAHWDAS